MRSPDFESESLILIKSTNFMNLNNFSSFWVKFDQLQINLNLFRPLLGSLCATESSVIIIFSFLLAQTNPKYKENLLNSRLFDRRFTFQRSLPFSVISVFTVKSPTRAIFQSKFKSRLSIFHAGGKNTLQFVHQSRHRSVINISTSSFVLILQTNF